MDSGLGVLPTSPACLGPLCLLCTPPPPSRQWGLRGASPGFMRHVVGFRHCRGNQGSSLGSGSRERPMPFCPAWTGDRVGQTEQALAPGEVGAFCFCCDQGTRRRNLCASQVGQRAKR